MDTLGGKIINNRNAIKILEESLVKSQKEKNKLLFVFMEAMLPNRKIHKNLKLFYDFLIQFGQSNRQIEFTIPDQKISWDSFRKDEPIKISDLGKNYRPFFEMLDELGFKFEMKWMTSGPMGELQDPEIQITLI